MLMMMEDHCWWKHEDPKGMAAILVDSSRCGNEDLHWGGKAALKEAANHQGMQLQVEGVGEIGSWQWLLGCGGRSSVEWKRHRYCKKIGKARKVKKTIRRTITRKEKGVVL